jgi:hypothetical protein
LTTEELLQKIRDENIGVYRSSASRLQEDVSNEAEIAHDYQGRLVYELLQNADDAMADSDGTDDRIVIRVTDDELWVGNSGRPLNEADVRGLCGIGASSKKSSGGLRRASIGHKGMGFKSVLEFTRTPEVYSLTHSMAMDADRSTAPIVDLFEQLDRDAPDQFPIMRLPWPVDDIPDYWEEAQEQGIKTLFRFPFGTKIDGKKKSALVQALRDLPVTTILFLKHLERVDIEIATTAVEGKSTWTLQRERNVAGSWLECEGLDASGLYRVFISTESASAWSFLLSHNEDVQIGTNRSGLNDHFWAGVELTEVSVAVLETGEETDTLPLNWRHFHLFLPTGESCPYGFLVNGAFTTDISRQEVRVADDATDYNSHLLRSAAQTFADTMLQPICREHGAVRVLELLDRTGAPPAELSAAGVLHEALCRELADRPFIPSESSGALALKDVVVPPIIECEEAGMMFRSLLPSRAKFDGASLPTAPYCTAHLSSVAVDLGAKELSPNCMVALLGNCDPVRAKLREHSDLPIKVDPVLDVLAKFWQHCAPEAANELRDAVKQHPVFPVGAATDETVQREVVGKEACFYPQQSLTVTDLPLRGLRFMFQEVCWGGLAKVDRGDALRESLATWQALFDVQDFKFPNVMRTSVLPCLELSATGDAQEGREHLKNLDALSAICQLAGSTVKPESPLRYQRLRSSRALFNLCRLPVPCRIANGELQWLPAYRVYFGEQWGDDFAIDTVLTTISATCDDSGIPDVPILEPPEFFETALERYKALAEDAPDDDQDDDEEVDLNVDDDAAIETDETDRWKSFFLWLGVNEVLRPVHFHDAEDVATGWLKTKGLSQPQGWAFRDLKENWTDYDCYIQQELAARTDTEGVVCYYYELHDLEHLSPLLHAAESDISGEIAGRLYAHLASHWTDLAPFRNVHVAFVGEGKWPGSRAKPPRAMDSELREVGENYWFRRLRSRCFCPTSHGPRRPSQTWLLSHEMERRFGRRGAKASQLLPVLDNVVGGNTGRAMGFGQEFGVRDSISPSNFTLDDARVLCKQIEVVFGGYTLEVVVEEKALSQIIRPAYRNLFELLVGTDSTYESPPLADVPLLEHDGNGAYRFSPGGATFYTNRNGIREVYSISQAVWTFVLEAHPAARRPLPEVFGSKLLEDSLEWCPVPGECALDPDQLGEFRIRLEELCCSVLARLRVERNDDARVNSDTRLLRRFIQAVEPVRDLDLTCSFQGEPVELARSRPAYVRDQDGKLQAFVVWDDAAWSPTPAAAEGLAVALGDLLQVNYLESFLSLIPADPVARRRILNLAGALSFLPDSEQLIRGSQPIVVETEEEESSGMQQAFKTAPETASNDDEARPPWQESGSELGQALTPLVSLGELNVGGNPVQIIGNGVTTVGAKSGEGSPKSKAGETGGRYAGNTDLTELDRIGMAVAMTYECERLSRAGYPTACVFVADLAEEVRPLVFDVSTVEAIDAALAGCPEFKQAMGHLRRSGVSDMYPGFDVLTLDPAAMGVPDRLIELKSSGVNARSQGMTWNEWKTAANSELRDKFYLYLVGNLRADIPQAKPFIRTIHDPITNLSTTKIESRTTVQMVQLHTMNFTVAEHLDLQ